MLEFDGMRSSHRAWRRAAIVALAFALVASLALTADARASPRLASAAFSAAPSVAVDVADVSVDAPTYPLFKQCDPRWGSDLIATKTVCQVGCLMSSVSMGLNGWGVYVDAETSNPGTLNAWLKKNGGYSGDDLIENALNEIVPNMWSPGGMVRPARDRIRNVRDRSLARTLALRRCIATDPIRPSTARTTSTSRRFHSSWSASWWWRT